MRKAQAEWLTHFEGGLNHTAFVLRLVRACVNPSCERLPPAELICPSLLPAPRWHGLGQLRETREVGELGRRCNRFAWRLVPIALENKTSRLQRRRFA